MRNQKVLLAVCGVIIGVWFASCKSLPEKNIDSAYVMVYDYYSTGVMNVSLYVDDCKLGETDIYGRFSFPVKKEGEVTLRITKEGYKSIKEKVNLKPGILVYFKIGSGEYFAKEAERYTDEKKYSKALLMIDSALEIENRRDWDYLKQVILKEMETNE